MSDYLVKDTELTSVADAIRTKGGTNSQLAFPSGFVQAIEDLPSGGTDYLVQRIQNQLTSYSSDDVTTLMIRAFSMCLNLESISLPNLTTFSQDRQFEACSSLQTVNLPKITNVPNYCFLDCTSLNDWSKINIPLVQSVGAQSFRNTRLPMVCFPNYNAGISNSAFEKNPALAIADFKIVTTSIGTYVFNECSSFTTLILRKTSAITSLSNINAFNGTPFASGGTGGTIYIPESLYDHLGDNSALDYKHASNWSTINGYGTITWAKIEGSYYETHYADGTLIPT